MFVTNAVTSAVFNAADNESTSTLFEAYLGGTVVASFVNSVGITNTVATNTLFRGFENAGPFDEIRIHHNAAAFGIDNLQFGSVVLRAGYRRSPRDRPDRFVGAGYARRRRGAKII